MFFRLPLLLALLLGLALGPVQSGAACVPPAGTTACGACCSNPETACCVSADRSTPTKAPLSVAPRSVDGKLFVSPRVLFVGLCPVPVVERPSSYKRQAA